MKSPSAQKRGFTLIELIIVIAIIAIIIAAVFVALDPVRRLNAARNNRRRTDITAIAQAMQLYSTDVRTSDNNFGTLDATGNLLDPDEFGNWFYICTGTADCTPDNFTCTYSLDGVNEPTDVTNPGGEPEVAMAYGTNDFVDLFTALVPNYLPRIPQDPGESDEFSGYVITYENGSFRVIACSPDSESPGGQWVTPPFPSLPMEVSR